MKIFFLLLATFFCLSSIFAAEEEEYLSEQLEYAYSIKNLSKFVKKGKKKKPQKYIPGDLVYSISTLDISGKNAKSPTDLSFNDHPVIDQMLRDKAPTHRAITEHEHALIRRKVFDDSMTPMILPQDNKSFNKFLTPKVIDKILPSFKTRIDL